MLHHSLSSTCLTLRQLVLTTFVGVVSRPEFQAQWRALQIQRLDKFVSQVSLIRVRNLFGLISMNNNDRRVATTQMRIAQLNASAVNHGRRVVE